MKLTSRRGLWSQFERIGRLAELTLEQEFRSPLLPNSDRAFRNDVSFSRRKKKVRFEPMLARVEIVVATTHRKQLCMVTALYDFSLLDHQNLVGAPDR